MIKGVQFLFTTTNQACAKITCKLINQWNSITTLQDYFFNCTIKTNTFVHQKEIVQSQQSLAYVWNSQYGFEAVALKTLILIILLHTFLSNLP